MEIWIGFNKEHTQVVDSKTTQQQINAIRGYELDLTYKGSSVRWKDVLGYGRTGDSLILTGIVEDRRHRVDEKTMMADRPQFAIIHILGTKITGLEYYAGHDRLAPVYLIGVDKPTYTGN